MAAPTKMTHAVAARVIVVDGLPITLTARRPAMGQTPFRSHGNVMNWIFCVTKRRLFRRVIGDLIEVLQTVLQHRNADIRARHYDPQ